MKTSLAIIATCVILSTAKGALDVTSEQRAKLDQYKEECKVQSGVDVENLKKLREGVFTEDPKFKEFLFCVSKKTGFQNDAGEVQEAAIIDKLGKALKDPAKANELAAKCAKQEGSPSDITYKVITCLYNSNPNHIIIVH